jgi:4-methyl-5(b-hydroxyethyl)-thiazole monophosphate biosynthesis
MKRVLLLLAEGVELLEAAAFTDVLGWANAFGQEPIELVCAAVRPRVRCTFGPDLVPQVLVAEAKLEEFDALAIPGGFESAGYYADAYADAFLDVIREFDSTSKPIAAVCVGALPLAKSGILKGRRATTYALLDGKRRRQLAELGSDVVDARIVRDGNVITSTGPSTATQVALLLVETLVGQQTAARVCSLTGFEPWLPQPE